MSFYHNATYRKEAYLKYPKDFLLKSKYRCRLLSRDKIPNNNSFTKKYKEVAVLNAIDLNVV